MNRTFTKTGASGMRDVAALSAVAGAPLTVCGVNGSVWRSTDSGASFTKVPAFGMRRVTTAVNGSHLWGVGTDGSLWAATLPGQWHRVEAVAALGSPVEDASAGPEGTLWITTADGKLWATPDGRTVQWQPAVDRYKRVAAGPGHRLWAISTRGVLWRRDGASSDVRWVETAGSGMEDLSVSATGRLWLTGSNGTVWTTVDGEIFTQLPASHFLSVSAAGGDVVWLTGTNGSVWQLGPETASPPPPPPPPPPQRARLNLNVSNQAPAYFELTSVTWSVFRQNLGGITLVVTRPPAASVDVDLPGSGQYYAFAEVWAKRISTGDLELAEFRGGAVINGHSYRLIVWNGQAQAADFRLVAEPAANAPGAVNPVVLAW